MVTAKRNTKDTVFEDLFSRPEYLLQLYKALHPEDTDVTEDMLQDVTIQNVMSDSMYNDLGFVVRDRLMILIEAQSTWSVNIIVRVFMYLAQTYHDRFGRLMQNMYSSTPVELPEPELYVIYTGDRKEHPETITLSECFFGGKTTALEVRVKMLYGDDKANIVGQYVRFSKVFDTQVKKYDRTIEAISETIRICKDENVLNEYLKQHEMEAVTIMMSLFDAEYIGRLHDHEQREIGRTEGRAEGRTEGRAEGRTEGARETLRKNILNMKQNKLSDELISQYLNISVDEIKEIIKDIQ